MSEPSQKRGILRDRYILALAGLMLAWAAVRAYASWRHPVPYLFPDEYIYVAISRALGHGSLYVRGGLIHFPEVMEPLLAAPLWRLFSVPTAYHLVQLENVIAAALTAIPIYWTGRWLSLSKRFSLACAAFGLALPEMGLVALTSSDAIGYLVALTCIAVALRTLDSPTKWGQIGFLVLVLIATLTRLEYFALAPAYIAAAVAVDGRRSVRTHSIAFLSLVPAVAVAILAVLGYYTISAHSILSVSYLEWVGRQLFFLTVECGAVIVPGALIGLLTPAERRERAFGALTVAFSALLVLEAAKVASDTSRYTERYVAPVLVFVPLGFGLYLRKRPRHRLVALVLAVLIAIAASRTPVSQLASPVNSEFVEALNAAGGRLSAGSLSLLVALLTTAGAAGSLLVANRVGARVALGVAIGVAALISVVATVHDDRGAQRARNLYGDSLDWVDKAATGPVTVIQTPAGDLTPLLFEMYWNPSATREVLLDAAVPTDLAFKTSKLVVGPTGQLANVPGEFLFYSYATSAQFGSAHRVARYGPFALWRPEGKARIRSAVEGRYIDGLLGPFGEIHAWPARRGDAVRVTFHLSVPASRSAPVQMEIAGTKLMLEPGGHANVSCASAVGPMRIGFVAAGGVAPPKQTRLVTALMSRVTTTDRRARARAAPSCTVAH